MINLGMGGDALNRDSSLSVNAIRQPLIVREEGKPPMHYVSSFLFCLVLCFVFGSDYDKLTGFPRYF
jgi:hypothetical protein